MAIKPLTIQSSVGLTGDQHKWQDSQARGAMANVIDNIEGVSIDTSQADAAISGIPTPFARELMFKQAFKVSKNKVVEGGLNEYFLKMRGEWRGVVAALALGYQRFSKVKQVYLEYSSNNQGDNQNLYEPKGAFGKMLFERKDEWCDKNAGDNRPFICLIKFDGKLVGGTSPETLFFTNTTYKLESKENEPYIKDGKFAEPDLDRLDTAELQTLYAYVLHLETKTSDANNQLTSTASFAHQDLEKWRNNIAEEISRRNEKPDENKIPPIAIFSTESKDIHPFCDVIDFKEPLYGLYGWIYKENERPENAILFDSTKLLLPEEAQIARIILTDDDREHINQIPIHFLKAKVKDDDGYEFFALPLTGLGLKIYSGGTLENLLDEKATNGSTLTAEYFKEEKKLVVYLTLKLKRGGGNLPIIKREYKIHGKIQTKDLLVWPNFISYKWRRYFFYSEMPVNNNNGYKAMPFVCTPDEKLLLDEKNNYEPIDMLNCNDRHTYKYDNNEFTASLKRLIAPSKAADQNYSYEIYESNIPFKGVLLRTVDDIPAGSLIIKYTTSSDVANNLPKNFNFEQLDETTVGFDFGSTNTSIAYLDSNGEAKGLEFKNRVIDLFKTPSSKDEDKMIACEERLFFFQQTPKMSNSIKSILTLHATGLIENDFDKEKEVTGGFPSFSKNLPINTVTQDYIELLPPGNNDNDIVRVVHNMKWRRTGQNDHYKKAFVKSLMLHVYAELFAIEKYPTLVKWSYPSAMGSSWIDNLYYIWSTLENDDFTPLLNPEKKLGVARPPLIQLNNAQSPNISTPNYTSSSDDLSDLMPGVHTNSSKEENKSVKKENTDLEVEDKDVFAIEDDSAEHELNLESITDNQNVTALTEAYAVANYLSRNTNLTGKEDLAICFDIGGSTTDVSVLWGTTNGMNEVAIVKQNSIRFAAQLVSDTVRYYQNNFYKVLRKTCEEEHIQLQGLNDRYNEDTAVYFFNQIVDRLEPNQLRTFYIKLNKECPMVFYANMFVTCLIMYYAGILLHKVANFIISSKEYHRENGQPKFNVTIGFAGKGARLMDWLGSVKGVNAAKMVYNVMFANGVGEEFNDLFNLPNILIPDTPSNDVKYEVSKGLIYKDFRPKHPAIGEDLEILGESGFYCSDKNGKPCDLPPEKSLTAEMMKQIGSEKFRPYNEIGAGPVFSKFVGLLNKILSINFQSDLGNVNEYLKEVSVVNYINNKDELFQQARNNEAGFDYVAPILILEGLNFYDIVFKRR